MGTITVGPVLELVAGKAKQIAAMVSKYKSILEHLFHFSIVMQMKR